MKIFYINCINKDGPSILFMSQKDFESKGGLTEPWGSVGWNKIEAESEDKAKTLAYEFYSKQYPNVKLRTR
jgi:hypothetical protein